MAQETSLLGALLPLMLMSAMGSPVGYALAKKKGYNPVRWAVLCALPFFNFVFVWYCVGGASRHIEEKIDRALLTLATIQDEISARSTRTSTNQGQPLESDSKPPYAPPKSRLE